jgi:hypothetical protein
MDILEEKKHIYMGHSTELVKTGGGIKKRIFS